MKKIALIPCIILSGLLITTCVFASNLPSQGAGEISCDKWLENRSQTDIVSITTTALQIQFVQGYLVATSHYSNQNLKDSNNASILVWINTFCENNPSLKMYEVARALAYNLTKTNP